MRKIFDFISIIILTAGLLAGCKNQSAGTDKFSIVCTTFPQYDWLREITSGADNIELSFLLDSGVDLHSFQPSADDIIKISDCDIFVYVGGESDEWVNSALKNASKPAGVNLINMLGNAVKEEKTVEGMEEEDPEEEPENDEHIWLSLKNAETLCRDLSGILCERNPDNKEIYNMNAENYIKKLNELDVQYQSAISSAKVKTLLFGDRFPFRYLADDYGLDYYGAFNGCSAETEASFETIAFLAKKTDDLGLSHIIITENSDGKIAETIIDNTANKNQDIITMDSMQSIAKSDVNNGITYISIMENNLEALKKALNGEANQNGAA